MKKLYVVTTFRGFGKAWDEAEAVAEYERINGTLSGKYRVYEFEAKRVEDVDVDLLNWHTSNYAKFISQRIETR